MTRASAKPGTGISVASRTITSSAGAEDGGQAEADCYRACHIEEVGADDTWSVAANPFIRSEGCNKL
jgi:hypothetical protein